ncbi:hypothetical protein SDC9_190307 [bioreactor metagenome]|uniref:Uncharacterized protein n=1 Tax=bioreactor metagenome TaxID=1076179 RepID=A0A645HV80_9ZZZZ
MHMISTVIAILSGTIKGPTTAMVKNNMPNMAFHRFFLTFFSMEFNTISLMGILATLLMGKKELIIAKIKPTPNPMINWPKV